MTDPGFYSIERIAEMLGITTRTAYRLVRDGDIPYKRVGRRIIRIPKPEFDKWASELTKASA